MEPQIKEETAGLQVKDIYFTQQDTCGDLSQDELVSLSDSPSLYTVLFLGFPCPWILLLLA